MGRPKKAANASRSNGARANNKGKPTSTSKDNLGAGWSPGGTYVVYGRTQGHHKGDIYYQSEQNIVEHCMSVGKRLTFASAPLEQGSHYSDEKSKAREHRHPTRVKQRAVKLLQQCVGMTAAEKIAKLKKATHTSKVPIKYLETNDHPRMLLRQPWSCYTPFEYAQRYMYRNL